MRWSDGFNSQRDGILPCENASLSAKSGFNSQRDGILPELPRPADFEDISFNSQRDGILRAAYVADTFAPGMFQFPTGWNSTISANTLLLKDSVSIPNGMEFYHTRYISSFS